MKFSEKVGVVSYYATSILDIVAMMLESDDSTVRMYGKYMAEMLCTICKHCKEVIPHDKTCHCTCECQK